MNNVYEKNIKALMVRDIELANKLNSFVVTEIPQLINENGYYNIVYKNTKLHNPINPLGEAKEIFSASENSPVAIHLIFGIGLGYLFQVASANSKGAVILYEPDLNILKTVFTLVDFSNDILKENVYLADTVEKVGEYIHQKSNIKNSPQLLSTTSYRELNSNSFDAMVENFQRMIGRYNLDRNYTQERFFPLIKSIIVNIPNLIKEVPLDKIQDFYLGKTAVIASAGPTLDKNLETIKKYRDKIVLITVGTAMKTFAKHSITPDFLCIIEAHDCTKQLEGLDLSNVNFVTEPYSNSNLRKFKYKKIYSHISNNMPVNKFWCNLVNEDNSNYFSKGTVSYTALNVARILGCKKLVLVGQDLAYIEGQCYSKDSAYKDLVCKYNDINGRYEITANDFEAFANSLNNLPDEEERKKAALRRIENLNKSLYFVKGIKGGHIPTESVYAAFIDPLSEFTEMFKDCDYYNTSLVGAQIDGYKNVPLEDILKEELENIPDREPIVDFQVDTVSLKERIFSERENLGKIKAVIEGGKSAIKTLKNDLKRYRTINVEVLKSLKKISSIFLDITASQKETLFDFITAAERIDIEYVMKTTVNFNIETVNSLINKYSEYFQNAENKIEEIDRYLKFVVIRF